MVEELTLRPAQLADFAFCQRTYLEPMHPTIEKLGLDEASHLANFARRWQVEQVRIVMMHGQVIGCPDKVSLFRPWRVDEAHLRRDADPRRGDQPRDRRGRGRRWRTGSPSALKFGRNIRSTVSRWTSSVGSRSIFFSSSPTSNR